MNGEERPVSVQIFGNDPEIMAEDGIDGTKEGKHYNLNYRGQTEMGIFQFDKSARFSGVLQFRSIV